MQCMLSSARALNKFQVIYREKINPFMYSKAVSSASECSDDAIAFCWTTNTNDNHSFHSVKCAKNLYF